MDVLTLVRPLHAIERGAAMLDGKGLPNTDARLVQLGERSNVEQRARVALLIKTDDGLNNFDAVRLAMALLVVWSHCFALYLPAGEAAEPISILTNGHFNAGNIAVLIFFIISGFLICQSYLKTNDMRRFFVKRVKRIYPGYLAAIAICAFVVIPAFSVVYLLSTHEIAKTISFNFLLRNYFPPSIAFARNKSQAINGSLWSIPFEFWCYVGIATLGALRALTKTWVVSGLILCSVLSRAALDLMDKKPGLGLIGDIFGWPYLWLLILPSFLMGTVFFLLRATLPRSRTILIALLAGLLISCYVPIGGKWQKILSEAIFPGAAAYSVFYFSFNNVLKLRRVATYGDFSYGTYLFAFPIQQILISMFIFTFPAFVATSLALSLGAGVLSWHLIEKWFLARTKQPPPVASFDTVRPETAALP
jgi:peptidoglycan/LPS O-acetylase OafA/YrhL